MKTRIRKTTGGWWVRCPECGADTTMRSWPQAVQAAECMAALHAADRRGDLVAVLLLHARLTVIETGVRA